MIEVVDHHRALKMKQFAKEMRRNNRWMIKALCATAEYRDYIWFPKKDEFTPAQRRRHNRTMQQICSQCPVQAECNKFAKKAGVTAGIWAGKYYGA